MSRGVHNTEVCAALHSFGGTVQPMMHTGWLAGCKQVCHFACLCKKQAIKQCSKQKASRSHERSYGMRPTGMQFAVMQVLHNGGELPG